MKKPPDFNLMKESVHHRVFINAAAEVIYQAWLDSDMHSAMTGGEAQCNDKTGGSFTSWDGYITGKNLKLDKGRRILQSWRTTEFSESDEDSLLEVLLEPFPDGTYLTINHTNIPEGQTQYDQGWIESYIEPMKSYFK